MSGIRRTYPTCRYLLTGRCHGQWRTTKLDARAPPCCRVHLAIQSVLASPPQPGWSTSAARPQQHKQSLVEAAARGNNSEAAPIGWVASVRWLAATLEISRPSCSVDWGWADQPSRSGASRSSPAISHFDFESASDGAVAGWAGAASGPASQPAPASPGQPNRLTEDGRGRRHWLVQCRGCCERDSEGWG